VPYLENECERRLLEDRTQRALELGESMARTGMEGVGGTLGRYSPHCAAPTSATGTASALSGVVNAILATASTTAVWLSVSVHSQAAQRLGVILASKQLILKLDFINSLVILLLSLRH
jgi:hypothetical protein